MVKMDSIKTEMLLDGQIKLMKLVINSKTVPIPNSTLSVDEIINNITGFIYDPRAHVTFDSRFWRFEDLFVYDVASQDDV